MLYSIYRNNGEESKISFTLENPSDTNFANPTFELGDIKFAKWNDTSWAVTNVALDHITIANTYGVVISLDDLHTTNPRYPMMLFIVDQTNPKVWKDLSVEIWVQPTPSNLIMTNNVLNADADLILKGLHLEQTNGDAFTLKSTNGNAITIKAAKGGLSVLADNAIDLVAGNAALNINSSQVADTVVFDSVIQMVQSMAAGKFVKDSPDVGDVTFYDPTGNHITFIMHITDTERTKIG